MLGCLLGQWLDSRTCRQVIHPVFPRLGRFFLVISVPSGMIIQTSCCTTISLTTVDLPAVATILSVWTTNLREILAKRYTSFDHCMRAGSVRARQASTPDCRCQVLGLTSLSWESYQIGGRTEEKWGSRLITIGSVGVGERMILASEPMAMMGL